MSRRPSSLTAPGPAPLTPTERTTLAAAEREIGHRVSRMCVDAERVAKALAMIRDGMLYRETHPTWEAYLRERWGKSREWARLQMSMGRHLRAASEASPSTETVDGAPAEEPAPLSPAGLAGREATAGKPRAPIRHFLNARAGVLKTASFAHWDDIDANTGEPVFGTLQREEIFRALAKTVEAWPKDLRDALRKLLRD